jgi:hypothetical protein
MPSLPQGSLSRADHVVRLVRAGVATVPERPSMILSDIRIRDLREGFHADWRIREEHNVERLTEFGKEEHECFNWYMVELSVDGEPRFGASVDSAGEKWDVCKGRCAEEAGIK